MVATLVTLLANTDTTTALKAFIAALRAQALRYNISIDAGVGVKDVEAGSKKINKFLFPPFRHLFLFRVLQHLPLYNLGHEKLLY